MVTKLDYKFNKLDLVVDRRPSTAEAPPIQQFSKIAATLEPVMQFRCPSRFRISKEL